MKGHSILPQSSAPIDRRSMLGLAAKGVATIVVSQAIPGCTPSASHTADTGRVASTGVIAGTGVAAGTDSGSCVVTADLTEGPFFVDLKLERSDVRSDPESGAVSAGVPLALTFNVSRFANNACTPLTGAYLDVWHCDAEGTYSDVAGNSRRFLRGYQITDASGIARFTTVYPGWYRGRAVHIHFKLRLFAGSTQTYEFTSQFFFNETVTTAVHSLSPYNAKGQRDMLNTGDGIYNSLSSAEKSALTLQATRSADGYSGVINLGVSVG